MHTPPAHSINFLLLLIAWNKNLTSSNNCSFAYLYGTYASLFMWPVMGKSMFSGLWLWGSLTNDRRLLRVCWRFLSRCKFLREVDILYIYIYIKCPLIKLDKNIGFLTLLYLIWYWVLWVLCWLLWYWGFFCFEGYLYFWLSLLLYWLHSPWVFWFIRFLVYRSSLITCWGCPPNLWQNHPVVIVCVVSRDKIIFDTYHCQ